jgi:hypothetical protein
MMGGIFFSAGSLFDRAKQAYLRADKDTSHEREANMDALVALVFSAASLEAFINEATESAFLYTRDSIRQEPTSIATFALLGRELEEGHGSVQLKFMLARAIFTGSGYKKGEQPYQDFNLLMKIRNNLVHLKPQDTLDISPAGMLDIKPAPILKELPKKILAIYNSNDPAAKTMMPWVNMISTAASAKWACNATVDMVWSLVEVIPASQFRDEMERQLRYSFQALK